MWRKTRKPNPNSRCVGSDANRNWDFHHAGMLVKTKMVKIRYVYYGFVTISESGASTNPCAETYAGPKPFSEPATLALSEFIKKFDLKLYISFHSFSQLLLFPYVSYFFKAFFKLTTNELFAQ